MSRIFLSLVGTQVMGTLQPWMALVEQDGVVPAVLLATDKVRPVAEILRQWGIDSGQGEARIIDIPHTLDGDDAAPAVIARLVEEAERDGLRPAFNLKGGLNSMISACVLALEPRAPLLIQASSDRVVITDQRDGVVQVQPLPEPLSIEALLRLQGVEYRQIAPKGWSVSQFCERGRIALPAGALRAVEIDGISFELVWNAGDNRPSFLVNHLSPPFEAAKRKEQERDLAHWATARERSYQIHDRRTIVLVRDEKSAERLARESKNRITVINVDGWGKEPSILRKPLIKLFSPLKAAKIEAQRLDPPKPTAAQPLEDNTLVVAMGTDPISTLLAVTSHRPRHLVICHSPTPEFVVVQAQQLVKLAPKLGLKSVRRVFVTVEGLFLDQRLPRPEEGARVHVNISPGTKGQGGMLAAWAARHGGVVWSLDSHVKRCIPLCAPHGEKPLPMHGVDPALLLQLEGQELLDEGFIPSAMHEESASWKELLAFMRAALTEGKDGEVLRRRVEAAGSVLQRTGSKEWAFQGGGGKFSFSQCGGEWLERLAAVAFTQADAKYVRARVRLRWNEFNENKARKAAELSAMRQDAAVVDPVFRLDLDVIGAWGPDLFLVSCKSNPDSEVESAAREVLHTSANLGRFGLCMLAHMGCVKAFVHDTGVLVLGWRELCQPEVLRELFQQLRDRARKGRG